MSQLAKYDQDALAVVLENIFHRYGVPIIVSLCCCCGEYIGVKSGMSDRTMATSGISHGYCSHCAYKTVQEAKRSICHGKGVDQTCL